MDSEYFTVEVSEGVALCTMRGPKMNAIGAEMLFPMKEKMERLVEDESVRVIVLAGSGGNFSVGADMSIMGESMDPAYLHENMRLVNSILFGLHQGRKPVLTEVDGWAVGGGMSIALASDLTYATERARFLMSFVRISIMPDLGCPYFLTRRVGLAVAKEMALTGRVVDAEEAARTGMVNRVIEHGSIRDEVLKVARRMATRSAKVLEMTKQSMNEAASTGLWAEMEMEAGAQPFFVMAPEHKRDVEEFLRKQSEAGGS